MSRHHLSTFLLALPLSLLLVVAAKAREGGEPHTLAPEMIGRAAIVGAARTRVVVARPDASVEAVDLRSGETLWTSTEAERPLLVSADTVLAQAAPDGNALSLVLLEAPPANVEGGAAVVRARMKIPLPDGQEALVADRFDARFELRASRAGSKIQVAYTYRRLATRMGPPLRTPPRPGGGDAVSIDPATGKWSRCEAADRLEPLPPALHASLRARGIALRPARVAAGWALALPAPGGIRIHRWDAQGGEPTTQTVEAKGFAFRAASVDGQHVLAATFGGANQRWRVLSLATGETVAELAAPAPAALFIVAGDRLLVQAPARRSAQTSETGGGVRWVEEPLELLCVDAMKGSVVWRRTLRDLAWRGTSPPPQRSAPVPLPR